MRQIVLVISRSDDFINQACDMLKDSPMGRLNKRQMRLELPGFLYQHISRPDQMRGYHGVEINYWGRFNEVKDIEKFKELEACARMK